MAKRKIDFGEVSTEIRTGGRSRHIPEGDYLIKIMEGSWEEGEKADYIRWRFQVAEGKQKGATLYANTSMSKKALWNLRNLIYAAKGKNVAGKAVNFDPENLVGSVIGATVADDEYDGRLRSVPQDFYPREKYQATEGADDDEDEEEEEVVEEEDDDEALDEVDVDEI